MQITTVPNSTCTVRGIETEGSTLGDCSFEKQAINAMIEILEEEEEVIIEYDSDGDEVVIIEEYIYETDSEESYEEEIINELDAVVEEDEEEEESEDEQEGVKGEKAAESDDDDLPAWAKMTLKKTDKGDALRMSGNLAAPITFTPFKNTDFTNKLCNPDVLHKSEVGERVREGEYLSAVSYTGTLLCVVVLSYALFLTCMAHLWLCFAPLFCYTADHAYTIQEHGSYKLYCEPECIKDNRGGGACETRCIPQLSHYKYTRRTEKEKENKEAGDEKGEEEGPRK
jgi:hypothetical protein